jgi:hypothetical protein
LHPSKSTTSQWASRLATEGHIYPYKMNGNNPAQVLKGNKLVMLALFRLCYKKATAAEVNAAFLFSCTVPGDPLGYHFFLESQITAAEQFLGQSRKCGSTTAFQASLPINLIRRHSLWNDPYPFGINGTSQSQIIVWDEAAVFVETTYRSYGKRFINRRVREEGPYNHSEKFTLTAAIKGGPVGGCWIDVSLRAGTAAAINVGRMCRTVGASVLPF